MSRRCDGDWAETAEMKSNPTAAAANEYRNVENMSRIRVGGKRKR